MTKFASRDPWNGGSPVAVQAVWPFLALALIVVLTLIERTSTIEVSIADFLVVTVLLGGAAAWLSGRAVAETWRPYTQLVGYMLLLAAAVRFVHFALFEGTLLSLPYFAVDFIILAALASLGFRSTRVRQMATQYGWLYDRRGPLGWSDRGR